MPHFKDHFSGHARQYASYRPGYPDALYHYLAGLVSRRELAWDCATGSGQAALMLSRFFSRVVATDASREQLSQVPATEGIEFYQAPAEASGLEAGSVDLVTVAQALHWFDFDTFHAEVRRVLKSDGVLAVWCYGLATIEDEIDSIIAGYYSDVVGEYWPPERSHIDSGYRDIPFPYDERVTPSFSMQAGWRLDALMGYLDTWSATQRYRKAKGSDPRDLIAPSLMRAWGDPDAERVITWPVFLRVGRNG